jgi:uncharacterized delta-60 repeat protein
MMSIDKAVARIRTPRGKVVGAAFLVAPDLLLTCWHVARDALEDNRLCLDFPLVHSGQTRKSEQMRCFARLERHAEDADLALLRLESPAPDGSSPIRLVVEQDVSAFWEHPCRAFGFPKGHDGGVWAKGRLQAAIGDKGWLQLSATDQSGYFVQPGFSGGPIWDEELNGTVGMVVAADPAARAAFCIPAAHLLDFCPELRPQSLPPNPYRGLLAFREQDADFFFGREAVSVDLWERVRRSPLVSVLGPSGSGKSSLVFAGVLPKVRANVEWAVVSMRPGGDPFRELAFALLPLLEADRSETDRLREVPKLSDALRSSDIALANVLRRILERTGRTRLLVILDQFEELFTLSAETEQRTFLDCWLAALKTPDPPWRVLLTLRADFLAQALLYRPFADTLNAGETVLLAPMSRDDLRAAVREPACLHGVTFEGGLVERILDDVEEAPGQLPLLEFALTQLWERQESRHLTHAAYEAIGGVEGSLMHHAEAVYQEFSEEEREDVRRVFIQMVTPGEGTQDTRRRALRTELGAARWRTVRHLADARLLVTGQDANGQEYAEVAHEALIQSWPTLREWMQADRSFRRWQERMRLLARQWQESKMDEGALLRGALLLEAQEWLVQRGDEIEAKLQEFISASETHVRAEQERQKRLQRRITLGLVIGLLMFALLFVFALIQRNAAVQEASMRATAQAEAEAQRNAAVQEASIRATAQAEAEAQRTLAQARQMAAVGQLEFDRLPQGLLIGTILGIEALQRVGPLLEADQLVRRGLDLLPAAVARMTHGDGVIAVAFSPDGRYVVSGSIDGTARVWEAASGREVARLPHDDWVSAVAFSPDGRYVVSGGCDKRGENYRCIEGTARVWEAASGREVARLTHDEDVTDVAFSPDGRYVVSGSRDTTARVWEATSGREVARMTHDSSVFDVAFSPDGRFVVSGSRDGTARVWEAASGREVARLTHDDWVSAVAFSPDGRFVVSGSRDGTARVWEAASGREVARLTHGDRVFDVAFSPDGRYVVSGSRDGTARVWEAATGREVARLPHDGGVFDVAFSPDGRFVVSGSRDGTARVWEAASGREVARLTHGDRVFDVAFSPDGRYVVSGSSDGTAWVWEVTSGHEVARLTHDRGVTAVAFSPDGRLVVSGSWDNTVRVWEAASGREIARLTHDDRVVIAVAFSPDGRYVVSGSRDTTARVWEAASGREVARLTHDRWVTAVAFSPDGRYVVSGSEDTTARVWEAASGREVARMTHDDWVSAVAFSPDGRLVVSGSWDTTARVWEAASGREVARLTHDGDVSAVAFSPDGRYVVSGSWDGTARVWEATSGREVARLTHDDWVTAVAFSPDGRYVVSGGCDKRDENYRCIEGTARVWEAATGREVARMTHGDEAGAVAFSPDGQYVVSASVDGTARVWEATSGREVARMTHDRWVTAVAFSPNGQYVVSGSEDGTARVWWWRPEDLIAEACRRLPRNLTREEWQRYVGPEVPYHATCPGKP